MMKKRIMLSVCLAECLLGLAQTDSSAGKQDPLAYVARYKDDKVCAISYTFDDGLKQHYTLVTPKLNQLGFKGTFVVNGSKINMDENKPTDTTRMSWDNLKEMSKEGHEISNHGWQHKNFGKFPLDEIKVDIYKDDSAILANTGIMPRTFAYPNNTKTPEGVKIASENRIGTRTFQRSVGGKSTTENLESWVKKLLEDRDWGVTMTHGITYGYDYFKSADILWEHLQKVKKMEDKIWVGTFREVAAYIKERDSVQLDIKQSKHSLSVTPHLSLDKELFTEPLTMIVPVSKKSKVKVMQDKKMLPVTISAHKAIFAFDPYGGVVEINF